MFVFLPYFLLDIFYHIHIRKIFKSFKKKKFPLPKKKTSKEKLNKVYGLVLFIQEHKKIVIV